MNDFDLLGGIGDAWTDEGTDICSSRVAFATENVIKQAS